MSTLAEPYLKTVEGEAFANLVRRDHVELLALQFDPGVVFDVIGLGGEANDQGGATGAGRREASQYVGVFDQGDGRRPTLALLQLDVVPLGVP